ncbi:DUF3108 domain-containing protein [Hydrogenophaga sp.]|uniref:DUF3108 domain-containing protein n=1 Tax=Hydrogenophaga sp. TaxID=1904254 RepID=UPI002724A8E8|nr:DUF3108 domain-containing protein [Hydrogenophaga sp.]MDO8905711.1 DUF3108 domain-containing protein [Hydrogenophaga sp.]
MRSPSERTSSAPRWHTLSALTVGVLLAHLYVLTGGWPSGIGPDQAASSGGSPNAASPATLTAQITPADTAPALPAPITSSRVRWILPKPPEPAPPPEIKAPPPTPRQAPPPPAAERPPEVDPPPPILQTPQALNDEPAQLPMEAQPADPAEAWMAEPIGAPDLTTQERPGTGLAADPAATAGPGGLPAPRPEDPVPVEPVVAEPALPPAQVPPSMRLLYEVTGRVKGINYNASGSLNWENQDDRYEAHMVVRAFLAGSREQTSVGSVASTGLVPERFGDKSRSERAAHFDGPNQRIRFSNNAPDATWLAGGQDRLSVFMQLAALLQAQPEAYPPGTFVNLQVAGPGDAEIWRFEMGAEQTLTLPAGELKVRHIKRAPRKPFDTQTELWLAPQLNHLPARLRITQHNGDHVEQSLRYFP